MSSTPARWVAVRNRIMRAAAEVVAQSIGELLLLAALVAVSAWR